MNRCKFASVGSPEGSFYGGINFGGKNFPEKFASVLSTFYATLPPTHVGRVIPVTLPLMPPLDTQSIAFFSCLHWEYGIYPAGILSMFSFGHNERVCQAVQAFHISIRGVAAKSLESKQARGPVSQWLLRMTGVMSDSPESFRVSRFGLQTLPN